MKYKFLEHTADVKFQAYGKTLEEAYSNAGEALSAVMTEVDDVKETRSLTVAVQGEDMKSLLYDYLAELIVLVNTENFLLKRVDALKIDRDGVLSLTATLLGDDLDKYKTHDDVKAVTYNEMEIDETPGKCVVQVVLDI